MLLTMKNMKIKPDLLETIEKIAKDKNTSENKILNEIIEKGLGKIKSNEKIPSYLIANKKTYSPDPERFMKMAGIIITEKPFNAVEILDELRWGN
jgi:hypothetical protein